MLLNIIWMIAGIALVLWGADRLTDGAVAIAERMHISQMVIGLTIVAMGTSMPEFFVSFMSALKDTPDMAVGNVVGSNIFNTLLIVGCAALVTPIMILPATVKKDIPFAMVASVALLLMCLDGNISRIDAGVLLGLFAVFMYITLKGAKENKQSMQQTSAKGGKPFMSVVWIVVGLVCLVFGSNLFVDAATVIARQLGVSDAVIGLTIIAGGTSFPELATSVVSARKGQSGIAIGNVLGSNVFNILLILGVTGVMSPMTLQGITTVDLTMLVVSMLMLWLFSFTKYTLARWEGALLTIVFIGYISYLVMGVL
ncbi:calcium/sodium antiporter [Hoylesella timonensis]|uniref:Sodium:proton exchanger n=1 Tax=Hoylesella timonensis S9-PR14 TaxID=1401062 RepID=A0A098YNZ8_9BACT|nr:calcium/sodium antiporter [Hoylesella timonensis]KGI21066.1 sodium:proton exchanger [Hoylesella timonensis S9-PR14]